MSELVARTGRHQQRYEDGYRLIAGCIPFRYRNVKENGDGTHENMVEVLMISSTGGPGLVFPKGGWENDETAEEAAEREAMEEAGVRGDLVHFLGSYPFKSKTLLDEYSPEGLCKAAMYGLHVKEELECWPEKSHRERSWLTISEAIGCCRHAWMREALEKGFSSWFADGMAHTLSTKGFSNSSSNQFL
ncbi:Nudix hydrolase 16- mitochondrial [Striga hermonthica]|uniref:Nudix hydrolase 16- mitochondrial n=1 Tax=Striga hermonthica TaxID=68872 RepID=A0A9N7RT25_STRHE|nr:Nudix hydrolase 16- mitochondrial [Striga hermonthica]